jgi:uncharacterized protein YeeX (DUF496 family)
MMTAIITLAGAFLGVVLWILHRYDLKNKMQRELEDIPSKKILWEGKRDEALSKNDMDGVTIAIDMLNQLRSRKAYLLQRLGQNSVQ